jgi:hypothetical protein
MLLAGVADGVATFGGASHVCTAADRGTAELSIAYSARSCLRDKAADLVVPTCHANRIAAGTGACLASTFLGRRRTELLITDNAADTSGSRWSLVIIYLILLKVHGKQLGQPYEYAHGDLSCTS